MWGVTPLFKNPQNLNEVQPITYAKADQVAMYMGSTVK